MYVCMHVYIPINGLLHETNVLHMVLYQALWNPGTIARLRTFQVSGSAGIRPLPIMGARISARIPLSYAFEFSLRMYFTIEGSETTKKDLGPKSNLYTPPNFWREK